MPFVIDGLEAGQPVMAAVVPRRIDLLRDALGPAATAVQFVDMTDLGANPARIIPAWQDFIDAHAESGQPVRGIGEPIWHGRSGQPSSPSASSTRRCSTWRSTRTPRCG